MKALGDAEASAPTRIFCDRTAQVWILVAQHEGERVLEVRHGCVIWTAAAVPAGSRRDCAASVQAAGPACALGLLAPDAVLHRDRNAAPACLRLVPHRSCAPR